MNDIQYAALARVNELIGISAYERGRVEHVPAAVREVVILAELEHHGVIQQVHDERSCSALCRAVNACAYIEDRISSRVKCACALEVKAEEHRIAGLFAGRKLIEMDISVQGAVDDLDKILLLSCPVIHRGHVLARCLRPLRDERLTGPAASCPGKAVGVGKAAGRVLPHYRHRLAADIGRTEGCAGAEVVASEAYDTVYLRIALRQVEHNVVLAFVLLNDLAVDHDRRAAYEFFRLCALNGVRLKVRQPNRRRRRLGSRSRRGRRGRHCSLRGLVKTVVCLHGAVNDVHKRSDQNDQKQHLDRNFHRISLLLFLFHLYPPHI